MPLPLLALLVTAGMTAASPSPKGGPRPTADGGLAEDAYTRLLDDINSKEDQAKAMLGQIEASPDDFESVPETVAVLKSTLAELAAQRSALERRRAALPTTISDDPTPPPAADTQNLPRTATPGPSSKINDERWDAETLSSSVPDNRTLTSMTVATAALGGVGGAFFVWQAAIPTARLGGSLLRPFAASGPFPALGRSLTNVRPISSGRLRGFVRGNTYLPGGNAAARELFARLSGRTPKPAFDRVVLPGGKEVVYRATSRSGIPKLEVVNHVQKSLEKISFPPP